MGNVSGTPEKLSLRAFLFRTALTALEEQGWAVERLPHSGKSSVRRISKGKLSKRVSIRTSQDTWIAFPRKSDDTAWATLADMDYVIAATVDSRDHPKFARVHLFDGDEMRARFDRAYAARRRAGYSLPIGRGIWLSLYDEESADPVTLIGAGAGLVHPPIRTVPLKGHQADRYSDERDFPLNESGTQEIPLTIAEAKRRLALSLGVNEGDVKITISS